LGTVEKVLLDAAHDAESIYKLMDHNQIEPFIDLNFLAKKNFSEECGIKISSEGIPICPIKKKMKPNGFDQSLNRQKWRFPFVSTITEQLQANKFMNLYKNKDIKVVFPLFVCTLRH